VSLYAARDAFSVGDLGEWTDFAFKTARAGPQINFQWSCPLSVAELKRNRHTLPLPPAEYTLKGLGPTETILPQSISSDGTVKDLPAQEEVAQLPEGAIPKPSNSVPSSGKPPPTNTEQFLSDLNQLTVVGRAI
jgi:hypothetical protein